MNPNSCRILTYGKDETLLMTRKAILETARFTCDTAHTAEDFVGCITPHRVGMTFSSFVIPFRRKSSK